jgi:hypothetical protein
MSLIGTIIYRDHHWMNTRGEVLFGLTCGFDCSRPGCHDEQVLLASDLPAWIAPSFI